MVRKTEEEQKQLAERYKASWHDRLIQEVVGGGCRVSSSQDALEAAALLRLLADELDPGRVGDPTKAGKYMKLLKNLIRYNPEGLPPWEWKPEPEEV
jgi:hypothetical protein